MQIAKRQECRAEGRRSVITKRVNRRTLGLCVFVLGTFLATNGLATTGLGQEWAKEMFESTAHDFGTVARGAKVEHKFIFENIYKEDVHVVSVRSTCGCTVPKIEKKTIKTWEKGEILAVLDTRGYYGRRSATLIVTLDKPFTAEVRLQIHTNIRSDVVVQPGWVQLGTVRQGTPVEKKLTVTYAGRADWKIIEVESANPHITAQAVRKPSRSRTKTTYELVVQLDKDAPIGYLQEHLTLVTNDKSNRISRVPVAVEGRVVSSAAVTATPSPLLLGVVASGKSVSRPLVTQGEKPFSILSAVCDNDDFKCEIPEGDKRVHLLPVTFTAGDCEGKLSETIRVETSLNKDDPLEVPVQVSVLPKAIERR